MEAILDTAQEKMDALEQRIADFKEYQAKIHELEAYYTSQQWKDDFAMDEEGKSLRGLKEVCFQRMAFIICLKEIRS